MLLLAAATPLDQVAQTQVLIEKGPITFMAAIMTIAAALLFLLVLKMHSKHLLKIEQLNAAHAVELKQVYKEDRDRAKEDRATGERMVVALELFNELSDPIRELATDARRRNREARETGRAKPSRRSAMAMEAGTVVIPPSGRPPPESAGDE